MDSTKLSKGQSNEVSGSRKPRNLPGIYRHEAAGKEITTVADPNDGSIQADALVRVGYHRVGDVPTRAAMNASREAAEKLVFNGTSDPSLNEIKEAKEKAEAELASTKATLAALQDGLKTKEEAK
jgi:2-methylisocitrate lyase-like PEP mutase family enzyme